MELPAIENDSSPPLPPQPPPNTSTPKTIGILNIVFGSLMTLCIACSAVYVLVQIAIGPAVMAVQQQQMQIVMKAERQKKLDQLQEQEKAANDEKVKAGLRAQRKAIEAQPVPNFPDFTRILRDPEFQAFMLSDYLTGFILNVLMLVSGLGLLRLKEWGRMTAVWMAALKIIRLIALYGFFAVVIVPAIVKDFTGMMQEFFDEMAKAGPPGGRMPGAEEMATVGTVMGIGYTVGAIVMIILGSIYPIIVLIVLTRPHVKAACAPPAVSVGSQAPDVI